MEPGAIIADKYRLDRVIGAGATGVVWRATQLGLDRGVAIKLLSPAYARSRDARLRFTREARVAAALVHPAAVAVLDFGETDDALYLVMELLVGRSLRHRLEDLPALTIGEAALIGSQIAAALIAAHRLRLVHRDIKPENVFLERTDDGERVKVVDFGLAFIAGDEAGSLGRMTSDGMLSGTPAYMSPEQVRGEGIGPASDVYALGCVMFELVIGHPPFAGSVAELFTRQVYTPPTSLRRAAADRAIDPLLDELVTAMLSKSPLLRPPLERIKSTLEALAGTNTARLGRSGFALGDREARAVGVSPPPHELMTAPTLTGLEAPELAAISVHWIGAPDDELVLALAANAIELAAGEPGRDALVYAPELLPDELVKLVQRGACVVTDVGSGDLPGITARLRAGVADVVTRPVRADDLARKLRRARTPHRSSSRLNPSDTRSEAARSQPRGSGGVG